MQQADLLNITIFYCSLFYYNLVFLSWSNLSSSLLLNQILDFHMKKNVLFSQW